MERIKADKNRFQFYICLFLLAAIFAIRAAYSFLPAPPGDGGRYLLAANKLLAGEYLFSYGKDSFHLLYRTPLYPVFLAFLSLIHEDTLKIALLFQRLLGALSAVILYKTGIRIWGSRPVALAGAVFAGLHFHFLYAESYPLSETLAVFLLCSTVYLAMEIRAENETGLAAFAFTGLVAACAGLCRPELMALGLICAFFICDGETRPARSILPRIAVYLLPLAMFAGAWTLRNGLLFDYWGITPNSRIAFFDGPAGRIIRTGDIKPDIVTSQAMEHRYDDGLVNRAVSILAENGVPYQWSSKRIGSMALNAALTNPAAYIRTSLLQLSELLSTRSTWPPTDITETMPDLFSMPASGGLAGKILSAIGRIDGRLESLFLVPLFLAGCLIILGSRRSKAELLPAVIALYLIYVYAFLGPVNLRYRIVAEPFMGLLAGYASYRIYRLLSSHNRPPSEIIKNTHAPAWLRGFIPKAVLIAAFCSWTWFMANLYKADNARSLLSSTEAVALLAKTAKNPADAAALVRLGFVSLEKWIFPEALVYFDTALRFNPGNKAASDGRAEALFRMGRGREALEELKRNLPSGRKPPDSLYNIALIDYLSGNTNEAFENFSYLLTLPSIPAGVRRRILILRAEILTKKGEKSKAEADLLKAENIPV